MDREALDLVIKYPDLIDQFTPEYRERLLRLWLESSDTTNRDTSKTSTTALLYIYAKRFRVSKPQLFIADYLGIKVSTLDRRLYIARQKGLLSK